MDRNNQENKMNVERKETIFSKIGHWFANIFNGIKNFFSNIFSPRQTTYYYDPDRYDVRDKTQEDKKEDTHSKDAEEKKREQEQEQTQTQEQEKETTELQKETEEIIEEPVVEQQESIADDVLKDEPKEEPVKKENDLLDKISPEENIDPTFENKITFEELSSLNADERKNVIIKLFGNLENQGEYQFVAYNMPNNEKIYQELIETDSSSTLMDVIDNHLADVIYINKDIIGIRVGDEYMDTSMFDIESIDDVSEKRIDLLKKFLESTESKTYAEFIGRKDIIHTAQVFVKLYEERQKAVQKEESQPQKEQATDISRDKVLQQAKSCKTISDVLSIRDMLKQNDILVDVSYDTNSGKASVALFDARKLRGSLITRTAMEETSFSKDDIIKKLTPDVIRERGIFGLQTSVMIKAPEKEEYITKSSVRKNAGDLLYKPSNLFTKSIAVSYSREFLEDMCDKADSYNRKHPRDENSNPWPEKIDKNEENEKKINDTAEQIHDSKDVFEIE